MNETKGIYSSRVSRIFLIYFFLTHLYLMRLTVSVATASMEKQMARDMPACLPTSNPSWALILSWALTRQQQAESRTNRTDVRYGDILLRDGYL